MLSSSLLSYLLPLSLLQSSPLSLRQHPRPLPSTRISLSLPRVGSTNDSVSSFLIWQSSSTRQESSAVSVAFEPSVLNEVDLREERELGAVLEKEEEGEEKEEEEEEGTDWYYEAADEEELRQEQELWRLLLTREDGKISPLFQELLVAQPRRKIDSPRDPLDPEFESYARPCLIHQPIVDSGTPSRSHRQPSSSKSSPTAPDRIFEPQLRNDL